MTTRTYALADMIARLPQGERMQIAARTEALIAEEMALRDLRKAMRMTQARLARKLRVGQDSVSRIEQRTDMLLSTLKGYVAAMGGELELVARFPDRPPVRIASLDDVQPERRPSPRSKPPRKTKRAA
jgi:DNA-binding XRE family transcriptional regulator